MNRGSPYDGLNLTELLERMHDLVLPTPVAWLPQTDGWWILLAWIFGLLLLGAFRWTAYRRRNRYRREALACLQNLREAGPSNNAAARVADLVKRTALTAYPRIEVAALYGDEWATFLIHTGRGDPRIESAAGKLARAAYAPGIELNEIATAAERWIRCHRA